MIVLRSVTLLVGLLAPGVALACTCAWAGPFTRVALGADLVVPAEVRAHDRHSMEVAVVEVLKGVERRPVIRLLDGDGATCRPSVTSFPRGTRWIFALGRSGGALRFDYALSYCGEFWLEVRDAAAVGRITGAEYGQSIESAPLADVRAWIRSGGASPLAPQPLR